MDDVIDLMINSMLRIMESLVQSNLEMVETCCDRFVVQARVQLANFGRGGGKKLAAVMAERHAVFQFVQARGCDDARFTHTRNSFSATTQGQTVGGREGRVDGMDGDFLYLRH